MVRSHKSKRVSWPSDVNLCQIRLFLSEDCPSQVGVGAQDNLQVKGSWLLHSSGVGLDDQLPPGFEGAHSADQLKQEISRIPLVKWQCPPRFMLNPHWQVVVGEENEEAEVQRQREMRVFEAIYPRPSAIPPSPSVSVELEDPRCEDSRIPLIPITPIEDEDATQLSSDFMAPCNPPISSQMQTLLPASLVEGVSHKPQSNIITAPKPPNANGKAAVEGVEPDVVAAASAAFTAIMKSNEQGSLIDHDLLIEILSNPKLIEKLVMDYGSSTNSQKTVALQPMKLPGPPSSGYMNSRMELNTPLAVPPPPPPPTPTPTSVHYHHAVHPSTGFGAPVGMKPPPSVSVTVKDSNYYKSLIQQHGGEAQNHHIGSKTEALQQSSPLIRESRSKNKRPCIYFNSSRGCKNGANCAYQHDMPQTGSIPEVQSAKRMKVDREITGRT